MSQTAWNELDRLGTTLVISGHNHHCRLLGETEAEQAMLDAHPDITGYFDGGNQGDTYIASKLTLSPEEIHIEAYSNTGEKVMDHNVAW